MKKKKILPRLIIALILLAAIAALVIFVFIPMYSEKDDSISEKPVVHFYEDGTGSLTMENERLLFEMDKATTQFQITDKKAGKVWYSNPVDRANDAKALGVNKDNLSSTLTISYTTSGGTVDMNNYTYSQVNQNYALAQQEDGSIRVDYAIGKIERTFMIPSAITVERYDAFTSKMSKSTKKKVGANYTKVEPSKLDKREDKDTLIAQYPSIVEQALYILKPDTKTNNKETCEAGFSEVGYTAEEFAIDQELVAVKADNNGPVFNVSVIYRLDGDDLVVEVPYTELRCQDDTPLTYLSILPMFGAAGTNQEGFILVPEGGGAVINYNNGKLSQSAYYANLYGWDYATERKEAVSETKNAFPVFGMGQPDGSFICIIEGADSYAGINADIAGRYNSYNYVNAKCNVLHFDSFNVSARTAQLLYMYEKQIPTETLVQRYRFIEGDDYVAMAHAYSNYMKLNPDMKADVASEEMPVNVELVGAINKTVPVAGVPVDSVIAVTTFQQAADIVDELVGAGVKDLNVRMTGWANDGVRQKVLTSVNTVGVLGGDKGMKELIAHAADKDVDLFFDGINCFAYDSGVFEGFMPFSHAARFTTREQVKLYSYDIVTYQQADWLDEYYLVRPDYASKNASNLIKALADKKAAGVAFRDVGNLLSADYYNRNTVTREQVKQMNVDTLKEANAAGLKVSIKAGNVYAVPYADLITDMNLTGNAYALLDKRVPVYQFALHGIKNYTGRAINLEGDYQTALLECAEYGAGLNFTFMKENTSILKDSSYSCYTAGGYDRWKSLVIPMITRYQTEMAGLNKQNIIHHEYLADDVTVTTYEDGTKVYVNYSNLEYSANGVNVNARDYKVERGSNK